MSIKTFYKVEKSSEKSVKISIAALFFALIAVGLISVFIISGSINSIMFLKHIFMDKKPHEDFILNDFARKMTIEYFLFTPSAIKSEQEAQRVIANCIICAITLSLSLFFFLIYILHSFLVMIRAFITYNNAKKLEKEWGIKNNKNKLMKAVGIISVLLMIFTIINEITKIILVLRFRKSFKKYVSKIDDKIKSMNLNEKVGE